MIATIEKVEAYAVRVPLDRPLTIGAIHITEREYVVVEVTGGELTGRFFGHSRNAPVAQTVSACISPYLEGQAVDDFQNLYDKVVKSNVCLGTNGVFWRALSLVDCAVHDLLACLAGKPLCEHLGGERRFTPCMLVGGYPGPEESASSLAHQMQLFDSHNPAAVKLASCCDLKQDTQRLKTCRDSLSVDTPLMMDFFWSFDSAESLIDEAKSWAELNIGWVEDPFAFDDYAGMAAFAQASSVPLAFGDEQSGDRAFVRLMDEGGVDVVRLDATVCGGVTAFCRISRAAAQRGLVVAPHVFHGLHSHLAGVVGNIRCLETMLPETGIEAVHMLWNDDLPWQDGGFIPTERAGLGISWDEEALARYRVSTS